MNAADRKKEGQQLSLLRSGPEWTTQAMVMLNRFLDQRPGDFTFEQFRVWATESGFLDEPASVNAWGSLPRIAKSARLIEYTGRVTEAERPESHGRLIRKWRPV